MSLVNIHQAKTHLSNLLERVAAGEEVIIGKSGQPIAKLVPVVVVKKPRKLGRDRGKLWMATDFECLPGEILGFFYGENL